MNWREGHIEGRTRKKWYSDFPCFGRRQRWDLRHWTVGSRRASDMGKVRMDGWGVGDMRSAYIYIRESWGLCIIFYSCVFSCFALENLVCLSCRVPWRLAGKLRRGNFTLNTWMFRFSSYLLMLCFLLLVGAFLSCFQVYAL
ncbi:hypothetical protein B0T16DRAFT_107419 [Cercophora newfieldiana]|uniref:Transmembrane protein n=1 Tax=Cercophora newfieldiana TaxID=92897 RepID=A0AA40CVG6_9PEZI|nr:hypothetical protein B0T16DRAFT_107419 [Cercophora newfieldiana]